MRCYIGYDERERLAYEVALHSLRAHSPKSDVSAISINRLADTGLLRRPTDRRDRLYDLYSNAPSSTEFAISRFLVPIICHSGWALFTDCDVVFMADVDELLQIADPRYAVMVVKRHADHLGGVKMDNQIQIPYARKNWSSVILWNCDHSANKRLSLVDVQERRGLDLHQFYWLADDEIGELPPAWNWCVNVDAYPSEYPRIAHFTLGGPWIKGWRPAPHDHIWESAAPDYVLKQIERAEDT